MPAQNSRGIKWQDRVPNTEVACGASAASVTSTDAFLLAARLLGLDNVVRTEDSRILKQVFFGQLLSGKRPQRGPFRRYKDNSVMVDVKRCSLRPKSLSAAPLDRAQWRTTCCHRGI